MATQNTNQTTSTPQIDKEIRQHIVDTFNPDMNGSERGNGNNTIPRTIYSYLPGTAYLRIPMAKACRMSVKLVRFKLANGVVPLVDECVSGACKGGKVEVLKIFNEERRSTAAPITYTDHDLLAAIESGSLATVQYLFERMMRREMIWDWEDEQSQIEITGECMTSQALLDLHIDIFDYLVSRGFEARVNHQAIIRIVSSGDLESLKRVCSLVPEKNRLYSHNKTLIDAVRIAVVNKYRDIVEWILTINHEHITYCRLDGTILGIILQEDDVQSFYILQRACDLQIEIDEELYLGIVILANGTLMFEHCYNISPPEPDIVQSLLARALEHKKTNMYIMMLERQVIPLCPLHDAETAVMSGLFGIFAALLSRFSRSIPDDDIARLFCIVRTHHPGFGDEYRDVLPTDVFSLW